MSDAPWTGFAGPIGDEGPEDEYVLAVEGLFKRFGEQPDLYHDLHLRIRRGEIVVIVGESGIGKSVFLKHLIGLEDPTRGGIWYRRSGRGARDWPIHLLAEGDMKDVRREISMVFQASSLFDWMSVYENIALPLEEHRPLIQARLRSYLEEPTELLVLLRRAKQAPALFAGLAQTLVAAREAAKQEIAALRKKIDGDARARRPVIAAFGADAADDVPAAQFTPGPGSPWAAADSMLASWSAETLGDLLMPIDGDRLPASVRAFRDGYASARRTLRAIWSAVRRAWTDDFADLAALFAASALAAKGQAPAGTAPRALLAQVGGEPGPALAKVIEEWAAEAGVALDGKTATGAERLRQALALLKVRPTLLAKPLERAGANAPAVFGPLVSGLAEFTRARVELERALLTAQEADLQRAILSAWLSVRPMVLDEKASSTDLLGAILDGFEDRPEDLSLLLARQNAAVRADLARELQKLIESHGDELTDQFTELVVNGLMASVKLDVSRDREKLPSELSGGMRTRVGLARSLATLPGVVLYDEPTAGLDPVLSKNIAGEILELQTSGVVSTSIVVTHDKDLYRTLKLAGRTRMLYLSSGRFLDLEGRPVRDPLRLGEADEKAAPVTEPGVRGYPPATFIEEFEPKES